MVNGEKSRQDLNKYLNRKIKELRSPKERRVLYREILFKFNISTETVDSMITFKRDINEFTNFEVFAILYFINRNALSKYYTQDEIDYFSNYKLEESKMQLPIIFPNMVQVAEDQWIGTITLQKLMEMRDASFINYDENEQRTFRRVIAGDTEIRKIFINNKSIEEIKEAMENERYIPDTITLNMPLDGSEFTYSQGTMKVEQLPKDMFNLIDGYHRYIAMSKIYNFNKDFDITMELRLVNFSTEKANQFIFQSDQKTRMKKIDSDSYNQYSVANKVIQRLNQDSSSNIQGMIGRNNEKINAPALAELINVFYCNGIRKDDNKAVIKIKSELQQKFNLLTEKDTKYLDITYTDKLLMVIMFVFANVDEEYQYNEIIDYVMNETVELDKGIFNISRGVRKKALNSIATSIEKWRKDNV